MFGSLLFALSVVGAEPVEATSPATCARPVAKLVAPKIEHSAGATRSTDCRQIALWLRRWERTSQHQPTFSLARRDVLRHRAETHVNVHAATALEQLAGRIEVIKLREAFAWSIVDRDAGQVCLEATPRDETEHLFYGSIRVWLDETDGALNQLQVINRSGETRFVWKNDVAPESSPIQLASATATAELSIIGNELPSPSAFDSPRRFLVPEADCGSLPSAR